MNYLVRINGIDFAFKSFKAASEALELCYKSGATMHRILGKKGSSFVVGGAL